MQKYVIVIPFDASIENTLVIHKNRGPSGVKNKINFVGGKVEHLEDVACAAVREFSEECGIDIGVNLLHQLSVATDDINYHITAYVTLLNNHDLCTATSMTDEPVEITSIAVLKHDMGKNKSAYASGFEYLLDDAIHLARGLTKNLVPFSSGVNSTNTDLC